MVEHSTHNPMLEGLNPAPGTCIKIIKRQNEIFLVIMAINNSTVVEHSTHNPMIKGLNPSPGTWRLEEKIANNKAFCNSVQQL